jgi:hypothetical protein
MEIAYSPLPVHPLQEAVMVLPGFGAVKPYRGHEVPLAFALDRG